MINTQLGIITKGTFPRIAVVGDSTASDTGDRFIPYLKRCLAALGVDADFIGAQNPTVNAMANVVGRDDEKTAYGGQNAAQVAASLTNDFPAVIAANGYPDVVIVAGNYNGSGTLAAQTAEWVTLYNRIYELCAPASPIILSLGRALQNGAFDGTQEVNNQAQYLAHHSVRASFEAAGRNALLVMAPLYTYSSWPPDDRLTTDNTHPRAQMAAYQAIVAASALTGVPARTIEILVDGLVGLVNGPGGRGALWCMASQNVAGSTVRIAAYDRDGRMGGRGVANANTQGTFEITVPQAGGTIKNLLGGNWEAGMVRFRLLEVVGQAIFAWPGAAVDGLSVEVALGAVTLGAVTPDAYAVGNYRSHTAAAQRPEVWFG